MYWLLLSRDGRTCASFLARGFVLLCIALAVLNWDVAGPWPALLVALYVGYRLWRRQLARQ